eukprot:6402451-Prymnesium_polylepis.1
MADAIAKTGHCPALVVADLRSELEENVAAGEMSAEEARVEAAAIDRLEAELLRGPPLDKCVKCRAKPRMQPMAGCSHNVLCTPCGEAVNMHVRSDASKGAMLSRLLCPVCRGFEVEEGADADAVFGVLDRQRNGALYVPDLMLYLLVGAGQVAHRPALAHAS